MFAFNKSERKEFDYIDYVITVNVVAFLCCFVSAPIAWALFFVLCSAPLRLSLVEIDGNSKTTGYFKQYYKQEMAHFCHTSFERTRRVHEGSQWKGKSDPTRQTRFDMEVLIGKRKVTNTILNYFSSQS